LTHEPNDEELDRRIAALIERTDQSVQSERLHRARRRPRGRPSSGFEKASRYAARYWQLRRGGLSSWHAKQAVAAEYDKTVQHVSECVRIVNEIGSLGDYIEPDRFFEGV
jgi:hypothetical protein